MPKRFREARKLNKLKLIEAAKLLGISQPTLSAWEGERKSPSIEALEKMANLYGVSTDYLLGRPEAYSPDPALAISPEQLKIMNGKPVWSAAYGWMIVDCTAKQLICADRSVLSFADAGELYSSSDLFCDPFSISENLLNKDELRCQTEVWLEPISPDSDLRKELCGWYFVKDRFVENEHGTRFYLDTYGAKWLAYIKNKQNKKS